MCSEEATPKSFSWTGSSKPSFFPVQPVAPSWSNSLCIHPGDAQQAPLYPKESIPTPRYPPQPQSLSLQHGCIIGSHKCKSCSTGSSTLLYGYQEPSTFIEEYCLSESSQQADESRYSSHDKRSGLEQLQLST